MTRRELSLHRKLQRKCLMLHKYICRSCRTRPFPRSFADFVELRGFLPGTCLLILFCVSFWSRGILYRWQGFLLLFGGIGLLFRPWFQGLIDFSVNFVSNILNSYSSYLPKHAKKEKLVSDQINKKLKEEKVESEQTTLKAKKKKKKKKRKGQKFTIGEEVEVRDLTGQFANEWRKAKIVKLQPLECQIIGYCDSYTYDECRKFVEEKSEESPEMRTDSTEDETSTPNTEAESNVSWMKKKTKPRKRKKKNDSNCLERFKRKGPLKIRKKPATDQKKKESSQNGPTIIAKACTDMAWQDGTHMNILRRNAPPSPPASHRLPPPIRPLPPPPSGRPATGYGYIGGSPASSDSESENDMKLGDLLVPTVSVSPERSSRRFEQREYASSSSDNAREFNGFERHDFLPQRRSFSPDRPRLPEFMADGLAYHERELYEKSLKKSPHVERHSSPEYERYEEYASAREEYHDYAPRRKMSPVQKQSKFVYENEQHFREENDYERRSCEEEYENERQHWAEHYDSERRPCEDFQDVAEFDGPHQTREFSPRRTRGRGHSSRSRGRRTRGGHSSRGRGRKQSRSSSPPAQGRTRGRGRSRGRRKQHEPNLMRRSRGRGKKRSVRDK